MPRLLLCATVLLVCASGSVQAGSAARLDESWKTYANKQVGYCISYPNRWVRGEAADGAGMWVESGIKKFSIPQGEMDVMAVSEPATRMAEYLQSHLEGLQKFERAEKVELLENRDIALPGAAGLLAKARYFDPQDGATWIDEVVLAKRENLLYRLELECRANQLDRFERVFMRFVESFRLDCNAK